MTIQELPPGMGRCEITGQVVPEEDLVEIGGQRVCAEGKAILLERMRAGEATPGELETPTVLRRFGCILLDTILLWIPAAAIGFAAKALVAAGAIAGGAHVALVFVGAAQILIVAIYIAYFTLMHGAKAQTLGKMAGKLKVVRLDGKPMDMKTGFIRALGYQGPALLPEIAVMLGIPVLQIALAVIWVVYWLANILVAIFDRDQQRAIHDRIAGTRVISLAV